MTTSGTVNFNPSINDLIEEAYERCGMEARTGYQYRTALRSLSFLLTHMANQGLNLWTIEQGSISLTQGQIAYLLPGDTVDIIEHQIRRAGTDINITRINVSTYTNINDKNTSGRPVQIYVDRQVEQPVVYLWPVPEDNEYTLAYTRLRRIQDPGKNTTTLDVPFRFYEAVVAQLAAMLAVKIAPDRLDILKPLADEALFLAQGEDRDRASVFLIPARAS
jgi:hypothetical protein